MVWGFLALGLGIPFSLVAQTDTVRLTGLERRLARVERLLEQDSLRVDQAERSTFYLYNYIQQADSKPDLKFGAYADFYAAWYSDSTGTDFQKSQPRRPAISSWASICSTSPANTVARASVGSWDCSLATSR
ncbi:MAG: hypothetical protein U0176_15170 [Bacteroidia bacterium]